MMQTKMTHIAMCVGPDELRAAEQFYGDLFAMSVAFRETMTPEGWATLPEDGWAYADQTGVSIGLTMLFKPGFAIDLEVRPVGEGRSRYSHLGLEVDARELQRVRSIAARGGCDITFDSPEILVFDDPYGMRWEFTTLQYDDPYSLSAGRREGRWHKAAGSTVPAMEPA